MARHTENFLEPDELLALLRAARNHSVRDWCMLLLGYKHALRAAEIAGLKVSDIDLKDGRLHVKRLKGSLETWQPLSRVPGQPLLDEFHALRRWLRIRAAIAEKRGDASDALFLSRKGGNLRPWAVWKIFCKHAATAGIEGRTTHSLKHSRVSHLLRGGAPISEVRQAAGHRSLTSTLRYVHATDESAAAAAARADAVIFG